MQNKTRSKHYQGKNGEFQLNFIQAIKEAWYAAVMRYHYVRHLQSGRNPDQF